MAYRFAMHENTGCTPNEQMFGQDDRLPVDLMFSSAPVPVTSSDSTAFAWQLREQVSKIHQLARDNLDIASRRQKRLYDQRSRENSYREGERCSCTILRARKAEARSSRLHGKDRGRLPNKLQT